MVQLGATQSHQSRDMGRAWSEALWPNVASSGALPAARVTSPTLMEDEDSISASPLGVPTSQPNLTQPETEPEWELTDGIFMKRLDFP